MEGAYNNSIMGKGGAIVYSGNELFDHIVTVHHGMSILVLDESFSEGRVFLHCLFKHHKIMELASPRQVGSGAEEKIVINVESLQDLSIQINQLRKSLPPQILVHSYLPELLVRHGSEQALKLLDFWQDEIKQTGHVEFYLLPKRTFVDFEKKLMAIVDGAIDLSLEKVGNAFEQYFTPIRIAKDEFHLKPIKYSLVGEEIVIKMPWSPATNGIISTMAIVEKMHTAHDSLMVLAKEPRELSAKDFFLLKELNGWKIAWIKRAFPDVLDDVLTRLAVLVNEGVVRLETKPTQTEFSEYFKDLKNSCFNKLRLFSSPDSVKAFKELNNYCSIAGIQAGGLKDVPPFLQEMYSRLYALTLQNSKAGWEETLKNMLKTVGDVKVKIRKLGQAEYVIDVDNCPICKGESSDVPVCDNPLSNMIKGAAAVWFGRPVKCSEVECVASNGKRCSFQLKIS